MKKLRLWMLWTVLGVFCLLYFILLILYTGFTNKFYLIWGPMGVAFLIFAWATKNQWVKRFVPGWMRITGGIGIGLGVATG